MLVSGEIGFEYQSDAHSISAALCDIDRGLECVLKLELGALNRHHLKDRQLRNEFLWRLADETGVFNVPISAFQVHTDHITAVGRFLSDLRFGGKLGDFGVKSGLVERPLLLAASGLDEGGQVRLGDLEAGQPDNLGVSALGYPALVLLESAGEVQHPGAETFLSLGSEAAPGGGKEAVEEREGELVEFLTHADDTSESFAEFRERVGHLHHELVEPLELLEQDDGGRRKSHTESGQRRRGEGDDRGWNLERALGGLSGIGIGSASRLKCSGRISDNRQLNWRLRGNIRGSRLSRANRSSRRRCFLLLLLLFLLLVSFSPLCPLNG